MEAVTHEWESKDLVIQAVLDLKIGYSQGVTVAQQFY